MTWKESAFWRTIRRWGIIFLGGGVSSLYSYLANMPPDQQMWFIPLATAILAAMDKGIREYKNKNTKSKKKR